MVRRLSVKSWLRLCHLSIILILGATSTAFSQVIQGTVKDIAGIPIPGASVVIKGSSSGTMTSANGEFTLNMIKKDAVLVFSSTGYVKKEVDYIGQLTIVVVLADANKALTELVVVGYGTQKKSDITGAISSVKNKDFKDQPVANIAESIEGKLSGINVTTPSGTPGAGLIVNIRGATNALYVVDGIPMLSESNSALSTSYNTGGESVGSGQNISSIADLNPDDIESVEVLKDASAAAIYGARAANGVILITTKRGKNGKTAINLNFYTGIQKIEKNIKFLSAKDFISLTQEAISNDINVYNIESAHFGKDSSRYGSKSVLQGVGLYNPLPYSAATGINTNWLSQILRTAPIRNYELSSRGGSEKTQFFLSGSYFDQSGIIIENYLRRFNTRLNLDHQVNSHLSYGSTLSMTRSINKRSFNDNTYTGVLTNALGASPLMPVYEKDGSYAQSGNYQVNWLSDNPVKSAKEVSAFTNTDRLISSVYSENKFTPALKLRTTWSLDYTNSKDNQYFSPLTVDAQAVGGKIYYSSFNNMTWLNENILSYQKQLNPDNYIEALGGVTRQQSTSDQISISGQGLPTTGGLKTISAAAIINNSSEIPSSWYLTSFLSRVNYRFKNKFLASFSFRADASSRFPTNKRVGYFPSASIGYNLAEESFLKDGNVFDALKFRVSYGLTGDQEIGNFQAISYWRPSKYNGSPGLKPGNLGNPNLSWQSNAIFNVGLDFSILHGVLDGSVEYFNSQRTKLLGQIPQAGTTGFKNVTANSGQVVDKGFEVQLNSRNIKTTSFSWTSSFNISFLKNRIKNLAVDGQLISSYNDGAPTHILKIGQPIGTFIGVKFAGVDQQTGDAMYFNNLGAKIRADQVNFSRDETIIGKARPDYFGGLGNNLVYNNWELNISMPFSIGNQVFNTIRSTTEALGWSSASNPGAASTAYVWANTTQNSYDRRWKKPGDITNIPRASFLAQAWYPNGSQYLENASFLKIKTVNLGYTFHFKRFINSMKLYAQVQNLYTFTKYTGFDPEVSSTGGGNEQTAGIDYAAYPPARTFTFGINLGL